MSSVFNPNIRKMILNMLNRGNAPQVGTAFSVVEILSAIYRSVDIQKIRDHMADRDRVILSKGHGASALYAVMFQHGLLSQQAIDSYYLDGSIMAGHVSHFIDNVEHSTGALGHGLSVGLGIALGSRSKGYNNRVFVVVGDGELQEGSNWEAIMYAGHKSVGNLCILVDKNERSQMGNTVDVCRIDPLGSKFTAFNFDSYEIEDGHNESQIMNTIRETRESTSPIAIICNTTKGKGVSFMEGDNIWHYRPPLDEDYKNAIDELNGLEK